MQSSSRLRHINKLLAFLILLPVACRGPAPNTIFVTVTSVDATPIETSTISMNNFLTSTIVPAVIPTITPIQCQQTNGFTLSGKIVFESTRDSNSEIYVINADGSELTRLTNTLDAQRGPAWSPNGLLIAFYTWPNNSPYLAIYVMNIDGTGRARLTYDKRHAYSPAWSRDGSKIVFISTDPDNLYTDIYVMNADGSEPFNITNNPAIDTDPSWSPDGSKIVFSSDRDGNDEIYIMNTDGSKLVNLTNHPASDRKLLS